MRLVRSSRQAQRREATRRRIVEAAAAILARRGPTTPIDIVCREAGCSKGAFYHHFRNRSQLDASLASHLARELTQGDAPLGGKPSGSNGLLLQLWAEGGRRNEVRRPLAAAIRELSVFPEGEQNDVPAGVDQASTARLGRLLALGWLAQAQWWTRDEREGGKVRRDIASARRTRNPEKPKRGWRLASRR